MAEDLARFSGVQPYASELYGVYQPLLGWRSRLLSRRIQQGLEVQRSRMLVDLFPRLKPKYEIGIGDPGHERFSASPAGPRTRPSPIVAEATDSLVAREVIRRAVGDGGGPDAWEHYTTPDAIADALHTVEGDVRNEHLDALRDIVNPDMEQSHALLSGILRRESVAAGAILALRENADAEQLAAFLMPATSTIVKDLIAGEKLFAAFLDPRKLALESANVSPVGLVHLFRQYFFELDSFLGPSVQHIWLSPGSTLELVEVTVRRTLTERTVESLLESTTRSEQASNREDEFSDIIRSENERNTKFGVSLNTASSFALGPIFTTQINTGTSYDISTNQKSSREQMHKGLRQQSQKTSTELKRSLKTTFRTVTEVTDTNSRRYVLANTTQDLINYELRRKLRQVGVQVQDYGTRLSWQAYVDRPGDDLGLGMLVHVGLPKDLEPAQHPELLAPPEPYRGDVLKYGFNWPLSDDEDDPNLYKEFVVRTFPAPPKPSFVLNRVDVLLTSDPKWAGWGARLGSPVPVATGAAETSPTDFTVYLSPVVDGGKRHPRVDDHPRFELELTPYYIPSTWLLEKVATDNATKIKDAAQATERDFKQKLFDSVRDRVKKASNVPARVYEELREEERIVVYRDLIAQLMSDLGVERADPRVQHTFAELIQSMFDVDRMLYFVAPEWWLPRRLRGRQQLFTPDGDKREFDEYSLVTWGGGAGQRSDNYYITEDSQPAPLGASLGWVIQLDGDNQRNAFLNAPWVKAVIPVREGQEQRALDWLMASHVEGSEGLDGAYQESVPGELDLIRADLRLASGSTVTLRHAFERLVLELRRKLTQEPVTAPDGTGAGYLATDIVYEHGFDPLAGGFRANPLKPYEIFDQWVEVVPTDQIVPVEVEYDPKTGRLR
jgi:hypothetical protein